MKKLDTIPGLEDRGCGCFLYKDTSSPRKSNADVVKTISDLIEIDIVHVARVPEVGHTSHVLQYAHIYDRNMSRAAKKLMNKFKRH